MRSPVLSVFFLTLFALLFGAVCAAPIGSPNVSSKGSCILGRCENADPENALFKFLDVRSVLHFKASLVPSEPPKLTTTPSPSPSSSASSSASMAAPTGVPSAVANPHQVVHRDRHSCQ
ncbi:hypothetical protein EDB85DRAFT_794958 [Lactarius pseudohatsudake]|nr:hypothetical protein EDB85DRAFT_794958 [Lactarius pseudohatsudake]